MSQSFRRRNAYSACIFKSIFPLVRKETVYSLISFAPVPVLSYSDKMKYAPSPHDMTWHCTATFECCHHNPIYIVLNSVTFLTCFSDSIPLSWLRQFLILYSQLVDVWLHPFLSKSFWVISSVTSSRKKIYKEPVCFRTSSSLQFSWSTCFGVDFHLSF